MGLLSKALEITWSCPNQLEGVIPFEGGMHLLMSVFAAIGYLYGEGLNDLLVESGVFASATVNQMLSGKDFDRAIYGLKLVDESLFNRFYKQFQLWCDAGGADICEEIFEAIKSLNELFNEPSGSVQKNVETLSSLVIEALFPIVQQFREEGCMSSATFKYWDNFLWNILVPFKLFLGATKDGDWEIYQTAKKMLLPTLFAANRTTYSRYMPVLFITHDGRLTTTIKRCIY